MSALDVAVVGVANVDLVTSVPAIPTDGRTVFGSPLEIRPGGKGLNQAVAVALNGGSSTLIAKVGDDPWGHLLHHALTATGVDTSNFVITDGATTAGVIVQVPPGGDSAVTVTRTDSTWLTAADVRAAAPLLQRAASVVVQLELDPDVIDEVLRWSRGVVIGTLAPLRPLPRSTFDALHVIVVNAYEAATILNAPPPVNVRQALECARNLTALGPDAAVVTAGGLGAAFHNRGLGGHAPAPQVSGFETTGAGDAFLGHLALAIARGDSLQKAVPSAVADASFRLIAPTPSTLASSVATGQA